MSFSNHEYLYQHLPEHYRSADDAWLRFLKRSLQFFGATLDDYDAKFDEFHESINPDTATVKWIEFWLENLFGWSWFPRWFTVADKRRLYGNFAQHFARRGTRRGIELFLCDFGITARVHTRSRAWGDFVWGEPHFAFSKPLHVVVEILSIASPAQDAAFWGDGAWGDFVWGEPRPPFSEKEILDLVRFGQPNAQDITVYYSLPTDFDSALVWQQIDW